MAGHGWVTPNPGGAVARCGGPALCAECRRERAASRPPAIVIGSADGVDLTVAWPLYALLAAVAAEPYPDGAVWLERDGEGGHVIVTFGAVRRSLAPREGGP